MKFLDLIRISSGNLWRRKLRTFLTVLGVIIGTASIVVMISLGLALNKATMDSMEKNGGLTTINVTARGSSESMYYAMEEEDSDSESTQDRLTDETVEAIKGIEHVTISSPVLEGSMMALQGKYNGYLWKVRAMSHEALEKLDFEFAEGGLPEKGSSELQLIYGAAVILNFSKGNEDYYMSEELPDVDLMKPMKYYLNADDYWQAEYSDSGSWGEEESSEEDAQKTTPPKKYKLKTAGVLAGDPRTEYSDAADTVYCDIEPYIALMKKAYRNKAIPLQPTKKSGKPYKTIFYNQVHVRVDNLDNVEGVLKKIKEMGYQAQSVSQDLKEQQKQYRMIQLVLGCIGAVSLLVAAIGIANTMMMSIYERTKEIGVIKVLGCNLSNIRTMFLMEAAFIGFFGGVLGLLMSYGISMVLNRVGVSVLSDFVAMGSDSQALASYIPPWLALAALVFAMLVGMVAGFFPALRAMRLSPLAAIRTE